MKFRRILFDLDGTLSESAPGITRSAQYALHRMGIEEPDAGKLTFFAGPPLNLTFRTCYGMNDEETSRAVRFFQERYNREGLFETALYPGIEEMLKKLSASGCLLVIASSKPEPLVRKVLEYLGISQYFPVVVGSDPAEEADNRAGADNKQRMISEALRVSDAWLCEHSASSLLSTAEAGKTSAGSVAKALLTATAMVGDRHFDIVGAKKNGITAIGVSYGYGSTEELKKAGADYVAGSVKELEKLLFGT